ncbi:hypothetical protein ACFW3D_23310 [Streptomyces sp. NPDC058864]
MCAVTLLTGCAAQGQAPTRAAGAGTASPARSAAPKCAADSYVWQSVVERNVLVGISDAEEIEIPAHGSARPPEARLVRPLTAGISPASVQAGARPADALKSLEEKTSQGLEPVGTRLALSEDGARITSRMLNDDDTPARGRFVEAVGVRLVTAEFSVTCTGGTVRGTVTTWTRGRIHEHLKCGIKEQLPAIGQEAQRRACPA